MKRHWKKIVIALGVLIVLVLGGSWFYAKVLNDSPDKFDSADLVARLDQPIGDQPTTTISISGQAPNDMTGVWRAASTSIVRYRVDETINGFGATAVGETNQITGTLTIDGTTVRGAGFTVDMASFTSDESRRDGQFRGRIMDVSSFPTATFNITQPIHFGSVPAEGESIQKSATGDLTLRGTTKAVTFDVLAMRKGGKIGLFGTIPVVFADYGIPNPSFATVSTEDHGELEFIVVLTP
ncbi:MAG TPA: YceI family protein [Ilumatobacteraceae bacterium]